jgi:hypothetical protein
MTYAVISTTETYGPETRIALLSEHETAEAAIAAAAACDPDYDAKIDAYRLGHNQASPAYIKAMRVHREYAFDGRDYDESKAAWEARGYTVLLADTVHEDRVSFADRVLVLAALDADA